MLTRGDIPRLLVAGLRQEFMKGMEEFKTTIYKEVTTEIASDKASEPYGWLGATPKLREWIGDREPQALLENGFSLANKDYEASMSIHRNAIDDDQYGSIKIKARELGQEVERAYDEFLTVVIEAGSSSVCYDGQFFFDTDHAEGSVYTTAQSNKLIGSGYTLTADHLKTLISVGPQFRNDKGKLAGIRYTHIMVPTDLEWVAEELLNPSVVAVTTDPAKKALAGKLKIIVNPYLANNGSTNSNYYLLDLSKVTKPFIFQNRKKPEFVSLDDPRDLNNFMRKKIYYGVDTRFAFGYGNWRYALKAGNT